MKTAAVIGTGMMGPGIAASLLAGGLDVLLVTRSAGRLEGASAAVNDRLSLMQANRLAPQNIRGQLRVINDAEEAAAASDLVVESGPEEMAWKQRLFAEMDAVAPVDTVLASNTSGLSITEIAAQCEHPERVVTAHFWNPPHLMPLVEIVMGSKTSDDVVARLRAVLVECGKTPVVVRKDTPGQLGNRLQMALLREAVHIVEQGIASVEDVDLAARTGFGLRLPQYGIFEHQDAVGLDLGIRVLDYVARDLNREPRAPDLFHRKVEAGETFYGRTREEMDEVKARRDRWVLEYVTRSSRGS